MVKLLLQIDSLGSRLAYAAALEVEGALAHVVQAEFARARVECADDGGLLVAASGAAANDDHIHSFRKVVLGACHHCGGVLGTVCKRCVLRRLWFLDHIGSQCRGVGSSTELYELVLLFTVYKNRTQI